MWRSVIRPQSSQTISSYMVPKSQKTFTGVISSNLLIESILGWSYIEDVQVWQSEQPDTKILCSVRCESSDSR
jgi:hypothetical protein